MVVANFDFDGNSGTLFVKTHFGTSHQINCSKKSNQTFRLGGTAVNDVSSFEAILLDKNIGKFRAFSKIPPHEHFEGTGILSPENWDTDPNKHCWITEYYTLDCEGKKSSWLITKNPIKDANQTFINLDVLDGGGNIIKRYRVSPFFGDYVVI